MAAYEQYKSLLKSRNYASAAQLAEQEAFKNPDQKSFWIYHQSIALIHAGNYKTAIGISEKALCEQPSNPYLLLSRSDALLNMGDAAKALTGYEEISFNVKMTARARKGILECLFKLKEWDKILDYAAQWDLPDSDSYSFRIQALKELNRPEEAFSLCNKWLLASPDNRAALRLLIGLEISRDGLEATCLKYERLAKIPSKPPVYGEIYAYLCKKTGKFDKAVNQYQKLENKTQNPMNIRNRAFALAKSGLELQAIPLLEELLRVSPEDIYLNSSYEGACNRSNNLERAWKFYHELISLHPDNMKLLGRVKKIQKKLETKP